MPIIDDTVDLGTLDTMRTFFNRIIEKNVATGQTINEEGRCLIRVSENGEEHVRESTGNAQVDVWFGVSLMDTMSVTTWALVEDATVPAAPGPYTVTLARNNLYGNIAAPAVRVYDATAAADLTEVAIAPAGGQFLVDYVNGIVTFNVAEAGHTLVIYYRYNMTVAERNARFQERHVNNGAAAAFMQVTCGTGPGEVYTTEYDTSQDYDAAGTVVYTGANGRFTADNTSNVQVGRTIKSPTPEDPMLGISIYVPM